MPNVKILLESLLTSDCFQNAFFFSDSSHFQHKVGRSLHRQFVPVQAGSSNAFSTPTHAALLVSLFIVSCLTVSLFSLLVQTLPADTTLDQLTKAVGSFHISSWDDYLRHSKLLE